MAVKSGSYQVFRPGVKGCTSRVIKFQFDGTDVTAEVSAAGLKVINGWSASVAGNMVATSVQQITINETVDASGNIAVPSDGNLTVNRALEGSGTATTDLSVCLILYGTD